MEWSLYNKDGFLKECVFSNNKSQLDIVNEVLDAIKEGYKVIFIKGSCGSGKSAIALNIAKEIGRTSIVVPIKNLQKQYQKDYMDNLYVLKDNKDKLNITLIDGRNNHKCPYKNETCDNRYLPCTIEIKKDNIDAIKEYLNENSFINSKEITNIKEVRRKSIALSCPHWSPIIPKEMNYNIKDAKEIEYKGLRNKNFIYYKRKDGCSYYDQFANYINADVIIFNSKKYELENVMDRKPETKLEIIDECDEFLDSLCSEKTINLDKILRKLNIILNPSWNETKDEIRNAVAEIKTIKDFTEIKKTSVKDLFEIFLGNTKLLDETEESSDYFNRVYEIGKYFENILDDTYVSIHKNNHNDTILTIVSINLERKLKEFLDKNKIFVMMSGTIHSEDVLKKVFGIQNFKIIEAETRFKGEIIKVRSGLEKKFNNILLKQQGAREMYLKALSNCLLLSVSPVLVQVNSFSDLPSKYECDLYKINNIKTSEELIEEQEKYKKGELIQQFKNKEIDVLYSTRCSRGIDLPGDLCNSIIITKYPYPNMNSLFWKILRKNNPDQFNLFYFDKARRELIQRVYRGLRSEEDKLNLLSPDLRVLEEF